MHTAGMEPGWCISCGGSDAGVTFEARCRCGHKLHMTVPTAKGDKAACEVCKTRLEVDEEGARVVFPSE